MSARGWRTTEFWLTVATMVGTLTYSVAGSLPPRYAALALTASSVAYAIARAIVKQGSNTPAPPPDSSPPHSAPDGTVTRVVT